MRRPIFALCSAPTNHPSYNLVGNVTLEELTSGNSSESDISALLFGQFSCEECFQYTIDKNDNIELCLAIIVEISSYNEESLYRNTKYKELLFNCSIAETNRVALPIRLFQ